jgi:hypothetical protein
MLMPKQWKGVLLLLLFVFLKAQEQPKVGWKRIGEEVFSLNATEFKYLRLPSGKAAV